MSELKLPDAEYSVYGVDVARYAQEGDCVGAIAAGHGRRSYAAINRAIRNEFGYGRSLRNEFGDEIQKIIKATWVVFVYTCGCTETQHAEEHEAEDMYCPCEYPGLPPCRNYCAWMIDYEPADTPGALPVIEVLW